MPDVDHFLAGLITTFQSLLYPTSEGAVGCFFFLGCWQDPYPLSASHSRSPIFNFDRANGTISKDMVFIIYLRSLIALLHHISVELYDEICPVSFSLYFGRLFCSDFARILHAILVVCIPVSCKVFTDVNDCMYVIGRPLDRADVATRTSFPTWWMVRFWNQQ